MDADLGYCFKRFGDDQVQLIDDRLEKINEKETVECDQIKEEQDDFNKNKPIPKDKGSHYEDEALVNQFVQDLRDSRDQPVKTRTIVDDQSCVDALRAELLVKVNACTNYLRRLRDLAQPMANTTKFVQVCNDAIEYFRRPQTFEDNFDSLCRVLEHSESEDVVKNIHKWWKDTYGSTISDINTRNQKFNSAITENNFAILSPTSRVISNAKKLIAARTIVPIEPAHFDIVRRFVRRLLSLDEDKRNETNPDELIDQLNNRDIDQIINYAEKWLSARDEIRNYKEEDPYEIRLEEAKARYDRQRIAQGAKKLALAALMCRLAVGSENGEQFDEALKKTVGKHKKKNEENLPIITGDIKNPEEEELSIMIQLEPNQTNMDQWEDNKGGIQEQFLADLCKAFIIPGKQLRIDGFDREKGIIFLCALAPHGMKVIDSLNGSLLDSGARMQAVRKCCLDFGLNVESVTLGEFGLKVEDKLMDPKWNKKYVWSNSTPSEGEYWATPIMRGGKPYHCPSGWKRYGIKVAANEEEFDARWGNWYVAYHGTQGENASKILTSGLKVSTTGCFHAEGDPRVYVSPSIEYCAHPRYAFPWHQVKGTDKIVWYQLVFQCRVNPASISMIRPETLLKDQYKPTVIIDRNFNNKELEWIILGKHGQEFIKDDIICYGMMMRTSSVDPATLTPSAWWQKSYHGDLHTTNSQT